MCEYGGLEAVRKFGRAVFEGVRPFFWNNDFDCPFTFLNQIQS
jgi:hypothetical protein